MPLFIKAMEIQKLVEHIEKAVKNTQIKYKLEYQAGMIEGNLQFLIKNSLIIPAKIANAAHEDVLYDIKMENATIIRIAAKELITDAKGLQINGYKDIEYLDLLRAEV
jgi:uncharacterized protein YqgV (UPF0045/DUF77 family)